MVLGSVVIRVAATVAASRVGGDCGRARKGISDEGCGMGYNMTGSPSSVTSDSTLNPIRGLELTLRRYEPHSR